MPTYDYKCDACGHAFEKFQSMSAAPIRKCPTCGENKVKRLIGTGAGVIFKGGGFYETDYRSESYKKDAQKENGGSDAKSETKSSDTTKPAASSETKSETKPAAKAESKPASSDSTPKKKSA